MKAQENQNVCNPGLIIIRTQLLYSCHGNCGFRSGGGGKITRSLEAMHTVRVSLLTMMCWSGIKESAVSMRVGSSPALQT